MGVGLLIWGITLLFAGLSLFAAGGFGRWLAIIGVAWPGVVWPRRLGLPPTRGRPPLTLDLIIIGLAIAFDPLPLIPFILLLTSRRGTAKGAAFIAGWFLCIAAITALTLLVTGGSPPSSGSVPSDAALAVRIAIGVGLVGFGLYWRSRRGRAARKEKKPPKWERGVDNMSLWFAALLAPLLQPWGLMAAGVTSVMQADLASAGSVVVLIVFVVLATSTYLALEVFALVRKERATRLALALRAWIEAHTQKAIVWGSIVVGLFLIGSGTYQLVA
jgi:hypothetical protein